MAQISPIAVTIGSQVASTEVVGPLTIDSGFCSVQLVTKTAAGGCTTPTAYTLQVSPVSTGDVWGTVPGASVTITATAGANTVVTAERTNLVAKRIRVISGAAFAAGTAQLYVNVYFPE